MQKFLVLFILFSLFMACAGPSDSGNSKNKKEETTKASIKGIGEIKTVKLNNPLDEAMIQRGEGIYDMKCAACHKLSDRRVVGPGFKGVTGRRAPEWIMNMITNVDIMLDKDPTAQKLLEECLTRMPNQNVSVGDARDILEYLYKNDMPTESK